MQFDVPIWVRARHGVAFEEVEARAGGRMPDFCIIGSPKCGTTSLDRYLGTHPQIFVCALKEPHYFSTPVIAARGEEWYTGLYADALPDQICGEASTSYTRYPIVPGTAERMKAANPAMKLVFIVRNPVDRVESEALQTMKYLKNVIGEDYRHMTLDDFLEMVEDPASPHFSAIVETSRYEEQIRAFEAVFPSDQILVLTQSDLRRNSDELMQTVYDYLGVAPHANYDGDGNTNVTANFLTGSARAKVTRKLSRIPGYDLLKKAVPEGLKSRLVQALSGPVNTQEKRLSTKTRARIEADLEASTVAVEARLGRPRNDW